MCHIHTVGEMITCPLCVRSFVNIKCLLKHIRLTHADTRGFHIQCNLQGCKRTFRNFHTYRNHVYTWHDTTDFGHPDGEEESTVVNLSDTLGAGAGDGEGSEFDNQDCSVAPTEPSFEATLQKAAALWILKTRELHRIPISTMNTIIVDVQSLFEVAFSEIRGRIQRKIDDGSASLDVTGLILEELSDSNPLLSIFHGLETYHQQMRFFRANFRQVVRMRRF